MGQICCKPEVSKPEANGYGKGTGGLMYHQQRPHEHAVQEVLIVSP